MIATMARLKKKIRCGTVSNENATVKMVPVEVMAQVVVVSSLTPNHHSADLAPVKVRHGRDITLV